MLLFIFPFIIKAVPSTSTEILFITHQLFSIQIEQATSLKQQADIFLLNADSTQISSRYFKHEQKGTGN